MIDVCIQYDDNALLRRLIVKGHAARKNEEGYEVCVATSTLVQGMVKALLSELPELEFSYKKEKGDWLFSLKREITEEKRTSYSLITEAFLHAVKELAYENPSFIQYETS